MDIYLELVTIQAKKNIRGKKGDPLVSIDKRMIHDE